MNVAGLVLLTCLCACLVVSPAAGAGSQIPQTFTGYLGDTILLSGASYNSNTVYLFLTGPGLPADGVALTDTTQLADQGQFTIVTVGSNQMWNLDWVTSRIEDQINPGTYTVYVVNAPVSKPNLAGHSYQILTVTLKDTGTRHQGTVSVGTSYTLNPGSLTDDTVAAAPVITTAPPTSPPTLPAPNTTTTTPPVMTVTPAPTQKSASLPWEALLCVAVIGVIRVFSRNA
jgi:hypothetical protein